MHFQKPNQDQNNDYILELVLALLSRNFPWNSDRRFSQIETLPSNHIHRDIFVSLRLSGSCDIGYIHDRLNAILEEEIQRDSIASFQEQIWSIDSWPSMAWHLRNALPIYLHALKICLCDGRCVFVKKQLLPDIVDCLQNIPDDDLFRLCETIQGTVSEQTWAYKLGTHSNLHLWLDSIHRLCSKSRGQVYDGMGSDRTHLRHCRSQYMCDHVYITSRNV